MVRDVADFRSDTLTRPTDAMRQAMAQAEVGDDVFGEDPTIRRLEREAAEWLGMEAALFVPSGTMGNQIAVRVHCRPGDELICEERCHVFRYEGGGAAALSGVQIRTLVAPSGFPSSDDVAAAVRDDDAHEPRSTLLVIENTHNVGGGRVLGPADMAILVERATALGLRVHIDGARLVNAAVASGCAPADLTRGAASVSMCLSKGMGAPVGSIVAGSGEFVRRAHRARKVLGGGMRQAGVLAAAGLLALADGPGLAAADHARARRLAAAFGQMSRVKIDPVESNIVMLHAEMASASELIAHLVSNGVNALAFGPRLVRFVTHRDVSDAHVDRCIDAVRRWTES